MGDGLVIREREREAGRDSQVLTWVIRGSRVPFVMGWSLGQAVWLGRGKWGVQVSPEPGAQQRGRRERLGVLAAG